MGAKNPLGNIPFGTHIVILLATTFSPEVFAMLPNRFRALLAALSPRIDGRTLYRHTRRTLLIAAPALTCLYYVVKLVGGG